MSFLRVSQRRICIRYRRELLLRLTGFVVIWVVLLRQQDVRLFYVPLGGTALHPQLFVKILSQHAGGAE